MKHTVCTQYNLAPGGQFPVILILKGGLKILYENWRKQLIENTAFLEAIIDFGEDENIEDGVLERGKIVKLKLKKNFLMIVNICSDGKYKNFEK